MTLQEIKQRLDTEFPDRHVSFTVDVTSFKDNPNLTDPDLKSIEVSLYDSQFKNFPCANLEDGIAALKLKLGLTVPEMELVA